MNFSLAKPRTATLILAGLSVMVLAGCPSASVPPARNMAPAGPLRPLVLLVVDDHELGQAAAREWRGRTEESLTVRDVSITELQSASRLPGDAIIFPCGLIGQLAEGGLIAPLE